jgi:hypothetical protein
VRDYGSGQKLFGRYTLIKILGRGGMGNRVLDLLLFKLYDRGCRLQYLRFRSRHGCLYSCYP